MRTEACPHNELSNVIITCHSNGDKQKTFKVGAILNRKCPERQYPSRLFKPVMFCVVPLPSLCNKPPTSHHELHLCWFGFVLIRVISWMVLLSKNKKLSVCCTEVA